MHVSCVHPSDEANINVSISANVEQVSNKSELAEFLHQAS